MTQTPTNIVLTNEEADNFLKAANKPPRATNALREIVKQIKNNQVYDKNVR